MLGNCRSWFVIAVPCLATALWFPAFAADEPADELVKMAIQLLADSDKDLRALGLEQVRTVKGAAATKQFAAQLPRLPAAGQAALLSALADRGDATALSAVLELLASSRDEAVRAAAIAAVGALGSAADLPLLVKSLSADVATERMAARLAITRLRGNDVPAAIAAAMKDTSPRIHVTLIGILANRRALSAVGSILADAVDDSPEVRMAAMTALSQLAGGEHLPGMLQGVLKAPVGAEREAAEKAVALVCSQAKESEPALLSAWSACKAEDQVALLSTLGRAGGSKVYVAVKAAMTSSDKPRQEAGLVALCNWPDATIADELLALAGQADNANRRAMTFQAFVRVGSLRGDGRADLERLDRMKQAMSNAKSDEERSLVLNRCRAAYAVETLRYVLPFLDQPQFAQMACETIVELAHAREVREPNKSEFDPALDKVIQLSKDEVVIERANRYKRGETWERPKPPESMSSE